MAGNKIRLSGFKIGEFNYFRFEFQVKIKLIIRKIYNLNSLLINIIAWNKILIISNNDIGSDEVTNIGEGISELVILTSLNINFR
jgi:hypothetical protein